MMKRRMDILHETYNSRSEYVGYFKVEIDYVIEIVEVLDLIALCARCREKDSGHVPNMTKLSQCHNK